MFDAKKISGVWMAGELPSRVESGSWGPGPQAAVPYQEWIFDLASLTKILSTSVLLLDWGRRELGASKREDFDVPLARYLPEFQQSSLQKVTLLELWEGRSGLEAHRHLFKPARQKIKRAEAWRHILDQLKNEKLRADKPDLYSDLGYLCLGYFLEQIGQKNLADLWTDFRRRENFTTLGIDYGILPQNRDKTLAAEARHAIGEVNDDNAASLAGISSHAGIFSSVSSLWNYFGEVVKWIEKNDELAFWFTSTSSRRFYLGWDQPSGADSLAGGNAPPGTLGHLGWTGTSLWWHPPTKKMALLLSNRVYPAHTEESQNWIRKVRREFHTHFWQGTLNEWKISD